MRFSLRRQHAEAAKKEEGGTGFAPPQPIRDKLRAPVRPVVQHSANNEAPGKQAARYHAERRVHAAKQTLLGCLIHERPITTVRIHHQSAAARRRREIRVDKRAKPARSRALLFTGRGSVALRSQRRRRRLARSNERGRARRTLFFLRPAPCLSLGLARRGATRGA